MSELELSDELQKALAAAADAQRVGDMDKAEAIYRDTVHTLGEDDYSAAIALHMLAVIVDDADEKLRINEDALARADRADGFPPAMRSSLLANIGYCHVGAGRDAEARHFYGLAANAASLLEDGEYKERSVAAINAALAKLG